jgi:hypothetical protein
MREVQIYIEGNRIELFEDEKILVNSSVQNVADIAKVFTDFSQSFTIPASANNNKIMRHFYATELDNGFDHQIKRKAVIEIDLARFRTGLIQVEKANIKSGRVYSYTVGFYGDITSLSDLIGDEKLNILDYTPYTHIYNGDEVLDRIRNGTDYDVRYPLISSLRMWNVTSGTNNITNNSHAIDYKELFPAIKISKILEAIGTHYGITFQGLFLSNERFTKCFMHLKNKNVFEFRTAAQPVDMVTLSTNAPGGTNPVVPSTFFDVSANTLHVFDNPVSVYNHTITLQVAAVSNTSTTYYLDVFSNGVYQTTISGTGLASYTVINIPNTAGLDNTYEFQVSATQPVDIQVNVRYGQLVDTQSGQLDTIVYIATGAVQSLDGNLDIASNMPDMKITDWIKGVLRKFNLTCYGLSPTTFQVEPLEDWYLKGRILDVTEYTDIDNVDIERIKLYKQIDFKHAKSESITNETYLQTTNTAFGDLSQGYNYDGGEYKVEVPFENLMFNKFSGTQLQVGYYLKINNNEPYIPKPVLLYLNEDTPCNFRFKPTGGVVQVLNYFPFGQDLVSQGFNYSLNFGADTSTFYNAPIVNGLYSIYYSSYLLNMYALKNRIFHYKMVLPVSILTTLQLNDRIVIRDKRYIINEMKTDLTSGEVMLSLILDFRSLQRRQTRIYGSSGGTFKIPILLTNGVKRIAVITYGTGVTSNVREIFADTEVEFTIPENDKATGVVYEVKLIELELEENFVPELFKQRVIDEGGTFEAFECVEEYIDPNKIKYLTIIQEGNE